MTKKEFLILYNTANFMANNSFNKLGLICKRFTKAFTDEFSDLADEEYYIRAELAPKEGETIKKSHNGQPIISADKDKELSEKLNAWKAEGMKIDFSKWSLFTPDLAKDKKLFLISPEIYETLNGFVFSLSEEDYFSCLPQPE